MEGFSGQERDEYPFPIMTAPDTHSSSTDDTLPRTTSVHTKSQRSSASSCHPRRADHERQHYDGTSTRLLSRLYPREERDSKQIRTLLVLTSDRLESETRRADQAEQRVVEVLERLRTANETILTVRAEAARANEELRLYKLQLETAQREILRAQDIVDQLEQEKQDAEARAARARTTARKLREDNIIVRAREEGRREGYEEGYYRGKTMGYYESQPRTRMPDRVIMQPPAAIIDDSVSDDEQPEPIYVRASTAGSPPRRTPPPPTTYSPHPRPRSNTTSSRNNPRSTTPRHVNEASHHAPILPVPTMTTPVNAPSPFHAPSSPSPVSNVNQQYRRSDGDPVPIPIRNVAPSPIHPPVEVPPDNFIPYADRDETISIPPPHEFQRSPTPIERSPSVAESTLPRVPEPNAASIRSRDFAYDSARDHEAIGHPVYGIGSPQSRTSTHISQFEIIAPPRSSSTVNERRHRDDFQQGSSYRSQSSASGPRRPMTPVRTPSRMDRDIRSPRGPRDQNEPSLLSSSSGTPESGSRKRTDSGNRSPLERLFKKRFRNKRSPTEQERGSLVPEIKVESPSTPASSRGSSQRTTNIPHLLSPDHANRPLPIQVEPVLAMHFEAPKFVMDKSQIPEVDTLPPNFMPTSFSPKPGTPPTPPDVMEGNSIRRSPSPPRTPYDPAPVPPSVVYPDPPIRSMTPHTPSSPPNRTSSRARSRNGSIAERLSPLSFGQPFASFTPSDD
ncbi:unnamed protein product [Somion occarium]|uniref:Uncharacterized protein n=1 Tax=Somion occarium TaxID=3059160 RepID=A0ABP1DQW2_9APHY